MKKYTPYIFPLIVIVIVFFLVYRWYAQRTQRDGSEMEYGNGIQIENLNPDQIKMVNQGGKDVSSSKLEPATTDSKAVQGMGSIRYEVRDGKVNFSVIADLPKSESAYTVWVRSKDGDDLTEAFKLTAGKGGYIGSAAAPQEALPLEVLISTASQKAEVLEKAVLKGSIEAAPASATPTATPVSK
ncbi:hypothetical protein KA082_03375 [Candidatus Woesebacteria bacterium]|nr:hypothetical protein [Candidatus Woesebacteria bacterium]